MARTSNMRSDFGPPVTNREGDAYAFRHDGVLRYLHTHNCPFPFIKHALYSRRSGHT